MAEDTLPKAPGEGGPVLLDSPVYDALARKAERGGAGLTFGGNVRTTDTRNGRIVYIPFPQIVPPTVYVKLSYALGYGIYVGAIVKLSTDPIDSSTMSSFDDSAIGSVTTELVTVFNMPERSDGTTATFTSLTAGTPRAHFYPAWKLPKPDVGFTPPRDCYLIFGIDLGRDAAD